MLTLIRHPQLALKNHLYSKGNNNGGNQIIIIRNMFYFVTSFLFIYITIAQLLSYTTSAKATQNGSGNFVTTTSSSNDGVNVLDNNNKQLSNSIILPSTLTNPPIRSNVLPGKCQYNANFIPSKLLYKFKISPSSYVLRFQLPDDRKALGLSTCACLLAGVKMNDDDEMLIRPYTPISTNKMVGTFDLLVKAYPNGRMSTFLTSLEPLFPQQSLIPTESNELTPPSITTVTSAAVVSFKHIPPNVKIQHPFGNPSFIGMIAGGTGITPMIQALHALLGKNNDSHSDNENNNNEDLLNFKVSLLYGSRTYDDILAKEMLETWSQSHHNQLSITHALSREKRKDLDATLNHLGSDNNDNSGGEDKSVKGADGNNLKNYNVVKGRINRKMIEQAFPDASHGSDIKIFVCGPESMYDEICGPRDEEKITGILGEMGYGPEQVYKF